MPMPIATIRITGDLVRMSVFPLEVTTLEQKLQWLAGRQGTPPRTTQAMVTDFRYDEEEDIYYVRIHYPPEILSISSILANLTRSTGHVDAMQRASEEMIRFQAQFGTDALNAAREQSRTSAMSMSEAMQNISSTLAGNSLRQTFQRLNQGNHMRIPIMDGESPMPRPANDDKLQGYMELLKAAEHVDEIKEIGEAIAMYLVTVSQDKHTEKREKLLSRYKVNYADIKANGGKREFPAENCDEPSELVIPEEGSPGEIRRTLNSMYNIVTVRLPGWLANAKGCPTRMQGEIIHRTHKAVLFRTDTMTLQWEGWLPLSQITINMA